MPSAHCVNVEQESIAMVSAASEMESSGPRLITELQRTVGRRHVLTAPRAIRRYCTGFRFGSGRALAVVRPGTLVEQWRVLKLCIAAGKSGSVQAGNTGLTGGATADGDGYDRMMGRFSERLAEPFLDFAGVADGERVIDVGCGTGKLAFAVARRCPAARITGVDFSPKYVAHALRRRPTEHC